MKNYHVAVLAMLLISNSLANAAICNKDDNDKINNAAQTGAQNIVDGYGGGINLSVSIENCSFQTNTRVITAKVTFKWDRATKYHYTGSGEITMNEDGSSPTIGFLKVKESNDDNHAFGHLHLHENVPLNEPLRFGD